MINYYWGEDETRARRAAREGVAKRRAASPTSPLIELAGENVSLENLQEVFHSQPLLGGETIVFFDHGLENPALAGFITKNLTAFVSSRNQFIFLEDKSGAALGSAITKAGGTVEEFKLPPKTKQLDPEAVKLFALAAALGNRDRKQAWLLYHDARRDEIPAEEVFWKFVWKVKTLLIVETAKVGDTLPLKPYPLSQAKRQVKGYKSGELASLSSRLVRLYHEARRGRTDFDLALEQLILEL